MFCIPCHKKSLSRYFARVVTKLYLPPCKSNIINLLRKHYHKKKWLRNSRFNQVTSNYIRRINIKMKSIMKTINHIIRNHQFNPPMKSIKQILINQPCTRKINPLSQGKEEISLLCGIHYWISYQIYYK